MLKVTVNPINKITSLYPYEPSLPGDIAPWDPDPLTGYVAQ